jgi:hypothetical protein
MAQTFGVVFLRLGKVINMPKTKFESIIFTMIMVFWMSVYTISLNAEALHYGAFKLALSEMWVEYIVVFCLVSFVTKTALHLSQRVLEGTNPTFFYVKYAVLYGLYGRASHYAFCHILP